MPARYCGRERGGRLGTDVVGIGDVNYDDIEDFAVGCPGCGVNGTGAVYLFLGMPNYANPTAELQPFEIVNAADLSSLEPNITGFGWSLALARTWTTIRSASWWLAPSPATTLLSCPAACC
ncbi:hypothetical protein BOX15_Mlig016724g2 [Macrostomum lignano]|uniref:Integrin alpha-2 domain-containing protein n=1 Tax=Macrostomum lignano TaxID=282301 RepID=A0A267DC22_9PLAT|nr:hypothetical protein BOX15_Mlig016724g2 [Macrostomum lignano]